MSEMRWVNPVSLYASQGVWKPTWDFPLQLQPALTGLCDGYARVWTVCKCSVLRRCATNTSTYITTPLCIFTKCILKYTLVCFAKTVFYLTTMRDVTELENRFQTDKNLDLLYFLINRTIFLLRETSFQQVLLSSSGPKENIFSKQCWIPLRCIRKCFPKYFCLYLLLYIYLGMEVAAHLCTGSPLTQNALKNYRYHCDRVDCDEEYIGESSRTFGERFKEHLKPPSPIYDHSNISGHSVTINNFKIVGREDLNQIRTIKEALYIRVNDPSLNRNVGKYHLPHVRDEVLVNTSELKLK